MRYPTRVRAEARTLVSPWWFWALMAAALLALSGCGGGLLTSSLEEGGGGGDDGGGGGGGGDTGTPLVITSTLSTTEINEIDGDKFGTVGFSFAQPVDRTSANDYFTVYAQLQDGSEEAIPINAIFWSDDAMSVELSFAASYNASYTVVISSGLKSADLTATLMENITYQLHTLRNPLDIDGADGDRADVAVGNPGFGGRFERMTGIGMVLTGSDLIGLGQVEAPIVCDLGKDASCLTANYASEWSEELQDDVAVAGREILPWSYGQDQALQVYVGADAQNLGNVSGDWRADFAISANEEVGVPYCNEGEGNCTDGSCLLSTGVGCGCNGTDTCENVYSQYYVQRCIPNDEFGEPLWYGCATNDDCVTLHGLGPGYFCEDGGVGYPDYCASTVGSCGYVKCFESSWSWSCDSGTNECVGNYGSCLQDQRAVALLWDDIADETPAASFASEVEFSGSSEPYPGVSLSVRPIGDVNGDGRGDLIVVEQLTGQVVMTQTLHLFLGREGFSGEIPLNEADATWTPLAAVPGLPQGAISLPPGVSLAQDLNPPLVAIGIAGVGDVNADGVNDFAIGSIEQDVFMGGSSAGVVQLFFGAKEVAALKAPDVTITSGIADDLFGVSLAGGDVDGDRKADLIVGAPGPKSGGKIIIEKNLAVMPNMVDLEGPVASSTNRAYLFSGAMLAGGTLSAANATATFVEGTTPKDSPMLGLSVAITDLNGDRLGDIAIGEPFMPTANSKGRIGIFLGKAGIAGSVEMAAADLFINHDWLADDWYTYALGVQLSAVGDINNDGYKDLAVAGIVVGSSDGNSLCTFLGNASYGEMNLDCDNSNAWVWDNALPDLLVRILGGGGGVAAN